MWYSSPNSFLFNVEENQCYANAPLPTPQKEKKAAIYENFTFGEIFMQLFFIIFINMHFFVWEWEVS